MHHKTALKLFSSLNFCCSISCSSTLPRLSHPDAFALGYSLCLEDHPHLVALEEPIDLEDPDPALLQTILWLQSSTCFSLFTWYFLHIARTPHDYHIASHQNRIISCWCTTHYQSLYTIKKKPSMKVKSFFFF